MNLERPAAGENSEEHGVQNVKIENHHYVVSIIWKNGQQSISHFPESGFVVADPKTNRKLGFISGEEALAILEKHSSEYNMEDFSWMPFVAV
jgi:hypothetical protein